MKKCGDSGRSFPDGGTPRGDVIRVSNGIIVWGRNRPTGTNPTERKRVSATEMQVRERLKMAKRREERRDR
jgi:hypothetical protein